MAKKRRRSLEDVAENLDDLSDYEDDIEDVIDEYHDQPVDDRRRRDRQRKRRVRDGRREDDRQRRDEDDYEHEQPRKRRRRRRDEEYDEYEDDRRRRRKKPTHPGDLMATLKPWFFPLALLLAATVVYFNWDRILPPIERGGGGGGSSPDVIDVIDADDAESASARFIEIYKDGMAQLYSEAASRSRSEFKELGDARDFIKDNMDNVKKAAFVETMAPHLDSLNEWDGDVAKEIFEGISRGFRR